MTVLQLCWVGVTVCTVIFVIVAAISALPKMKTAWTACMATARTSTRPRSSPN